MNRYNNKNSSPTLCCGLQFLTGAALFVALLAPLGALAANAPATDFDDEARWFQVELILFSQQTDLALDAEKWPNIEGLQLPEKLLELHLPQTEASVEDQPEPADDGSATEPAAIEPATTEPTITEDPAFELAEVEGSDMPTAFQILPAEQLQLTKMAEKLQRSRQRELLLHIGWQQPTYDRKHAEPVYFAAGMAEPLPVIENESGTIDDESALNTPENESASLPVPDEGVLLPPLEYATEEDRKTGPINPQFVGTITLSVERYLHVATDLLYRQAITQHKSTPIPDLDLWYDRPYPTLQEPQGPAFQQTSWQAVRGFQLKESRRMRSTEVHYLDHPFMGMVVVITPVELPEPAEEIQQTSPQNILSTPSRVRTTPRN